MIDWTELSHCRTRARCRECLTGAFEGTSTAEKYDIPEECPHGVTLDNLPESKSAQSNVRHSKDCIHVGDRHPARSCHRRCEKYEVYMTYRKCHDRECYEEAT